MMTNDGRPLEPDELDVSTVKGVWTVRSDSATTYYVDAERGTLLRSPGPGSSTGPYDGCWVPLVSVQNVEGFGRLRVGLRHRWLTDPAGLASSEYRWWVQRSCVSFEKVADDDVPVGEPLPGSSEMRRPVEHVLDGTRVDQDEFLAARAERTNADGTEPEVPRATD
jgi:hypothetical protein